MKLITLKEERAIELGEHRYSRDALPALEAAKWYPNDATGQHAFIRGWLAERDKQELARLTPHRPKNPPAYEPGNGN